MIFSGKSYYEVKELLKVSQSFISEWKKQAIYFSWFREFEALISMQKGLLKSSRKIANYLVFKGTILSDNIR